MKGAIPECLVRRSAKLDLTGIGGRQPPIVQITNTSRKLRIYTVNAW